MTKKRFHKGYVLGDTGLIDEQKGEWFIENINSVSDLEKNWDKVICNDIISNYDEVYKLETSNGGNLEIATNIIENGEKEVDLSIFNYNQHLLESETLKGIKGV